MNIIVIIIRKGIVERFRQTDRALEEVPTWPDVSSYDGGYAKQSFSTFETRVSVSLWSMAINRGNTHVMLCYDDDDDAYYV